MLRSYTYASSKTTCLYYVYVYLPTGMDVHYTGTVRSTKYEAHTCLGAWMKWPSSAGTYRLGYRWRWNLQRASASVAPHFWLEAPVAGSC